MEFEGTYPLPESQLDRFLMRLSVGYPDRENELNVLKTHQTARPILSIAPVASAEQILDIQQEVARVRVDESINRYILDIVEATRESGELLVGVSTRGAIALSRAAQAFALMEGRNFVIPDDVKSLAIAVFAHRVLPKLHSHTNQRQAVEAVMERIVESVAVSV